MRAAVHVALVLGLACSGGDAGAFKLRFVDPEDGVDDRARRSPSVRRVLEKSGKPVHEDMLLASLGCTSAESCSTGLEHHGITLQKLVRGLRWPDDPAFYINVSRLGTLPRFCLSKGGRQVAIKLGERRDLSRDRSLLCWAMTMAAGQQAAHEVDMHHSKRRTSSYALPLRSHYADMQFLHSMAPNGQNAALTFTLIQSWAKLTYEVAAGRHTDWTLVRDIIDADRELWSLKGFFVPSWRIADLFDLSDPGSDDARPIALGALLHMIQDSYAGCHTSRTLRGNEYRVHQYLTFYGQDPSSHAKEDASPQPVPGQLGPVEAARRVLVSLRGPTAHYEAIRGLIHDVFSPTPDALRAGPGEHCSPVKHPA